VIQFLIDGDVGRIRTLAFILAVFYSCVLLSVLIDLFFGVKRARRKKIARTSIGFRRTVTKLTGYFGLMILLTIADIVGSMILPLPYFTFVGAIGVIIVEGVSIYENIKKDVHSVEDIPHVLLKLMEHKDGIREILSALDDHNQKTGSKNRKKE
jgi:hypothetical protein